MPTLIIEFPAGRYHATPWGHHVNEGQVEWPPSPWRLLRALLATGYSKLHWPDEGPPEEGRSLIDKLASVLPEYRLPKAVATHSRHYMPMAKFKNGREDTSLVFDTWARIEGDLSVSWNIELTLQEEGLLMQLARNLSYLGRSESWVDARLVTDEQCVGLNGELCQPESIGNPVGPEWEQVPLMAPMAASDYTQWRRQALEQATAGLTPTGKTKTKWQQAVKPYPEDLLNCLQMQTNELQGFGWSQPPGSRRVFYWRRSNALEVGVPLQQQRQSVQPITAMLLSMATQSGNHALPSVVRTLPQAEHLHRQLVASLKGRHNRVLTGCDEQRQPLREPHLHAHIQPLDLDSDGHLDHFLIWAPMGLDDRAQMAIRQLRQTFTKGGVGPLRLSTTGAVTASSELASLDGAWGAGLRRYLGEGKTWLSVTSFVPPRYLKKSGANTLEGQVQAELASRGLPAAQDIEVLDPHVSEDARRQRHVIRLRRFGPTPPVNIGFTLRLKFAEPVRGPLTLGYASHYGLGQFAIMED